MTSNLLSVKDLTVTFQKGNSCFKVVDSFSFDLFPRQTLAIVGESGSGKTTLALALVKALPTPPALPLNGEILFHGKNLITLNEQEMNKIRGTKITMVFQDPASALNPVYTIGYQLTEVIDIHFDLDEEETYQKVIDSLKEVKLDNPEQIYNKYPHEISGGQRQRAMIAMACLPEPEILIADEPTTALDVTIQKEIILLLKELGQKKELAIILITHDMGIVAEMADDVIVMYASQAVEGGSKDDVLLEPKHPYTKALLAALPSTTHKLRTIPGHIPSIDHFPKGCHFHPRCPYAWEKCKEGTVPLFQTMQQKARCWLYDPLDG